jgi:gamma-glutamyl hercynylcysteine S-oxide synthase
MTSRTAPSAGRPVAAAEIATLAAWLKDARARTLALLQDLEGEQWSGPRLDVVNPPCWELGHVGWFQEHWCLRGGGRLPSLRADADGLYDSATVPHKVRWDLPLPTPEGTHRYVEEVLARVLERLERGGLTAEEAYFLHLAVFHEDMHGEAFVHTRQTLGYPAPCLALAASPAPAPAVAPVVRAGGRDGDVYVPGGTYLLGAREGEFPFVFDNEKWAHPVEVAPFAIARHAVTEAEFAAFADDQGYARRALWSPEGWAWRERADATAPLYWRKEGGRWLRRTFDRWEPLRERRAMVHVGWYEAQAFCAWAGRRLPTEVEWEVAAAAADAGGGRLGAERRPYPWGARFPDATTARLDGAGPGPCDVDDLAAGDSAFGVRQALGNVWEWTSDAFRPYPGFVIDPYAEYSAPWFGNHKVLRGGCWATRARLLRTTWRNFYTPDRRDVFAGFRTCAPEAS